MRVVFILLGVLGLLLLLGLALARVRVTLTLSERTALRLHVGFLRFTLFPERRRRVHPSRYSAKRLARRAKRRRKKAARRAAKHGNASPRTPRPPRTLRENLRLVRKVAVFLLRRAGPHLTLRAARLHIRVSTGDAASTAILTGAVRQSLAYILALLDRFTRLRVARKEVSVTPDYLTGHCTAELRLVFSIRLFRALLLAVELLHLLRRAPRAAAAPPTRSKTGAAPIPT